MGEKIFVVLIFLFLVVVPIVSSASEKSINDMTVYEYLKENGIPFIDLSDYITEDYRTIYMNFLVGLIYFLVIFNIVEFLPFFNSAWSKVFVSLAVSILGLIFLGQEFFDMIISEYEALGIIFGIFIPIAAILMFLLHIEVEKRRGRIHGTIADIITVAVFLVIGLFFVFKTLTSEGFGWYIFGDVLLIVLFITKGFIFGKMADNIIKRSRETGIERIREGSKDLNTVHTTAKEEIENS